MVWTEASSGLSYQSASNKCFFEMFNQPVQPVSSSPGIATPIFHSILGNAALILYTNADFTNHSNEQVTACLDDGGQAVLAGPYNLAAVHAPGVVVTFQVPEQQLFWSVVHVEPLRGKFIAMGSVAGSRAERADSNLVAVAVKSNFDPTSTFVDPSFKGIPITVGYLFAKSHGALQLVSRIKYCTHMYQATLVNHCNWTPPGLFPTHS